MRILCECRTQLGHEELAVFYRPPEDLAACVANCLDWADMQRKRAVDPWVWSRVTVDNEEAPNATTR